MGTGFVALSGVKNAMALRGQFLAQRDAIGFGEERAAAKPTSPAAVDLDRAPAAHPSA